LPKKSVVPRSVVRGSVDPKSDKIKPDNGGKNGGKTGGKNGGKTSAITTRNLNQKYSPKSIGSTAAVLTPSNGYCSLSPFGAHHWIIEPPDGTVSVGICRYCGVEREFLNSITISAYNPRDKGEY